ncbi:MAG TPA: L,D-transpeptidase, partial [Pyrinomonadaceae bacterium]|nr:L,D-transpeptidase [Pyrinomonadaceae bacterium]
VGFALFVLLLVSCEQRPTTTTSNQPVDTNSNSNAQVSTNTNQSAGTNAEAASRVPITMPVVDALLSDEAFVSELRKTVQPTDEQFDKLKNAARDAVLKLGEDGSDDDARSTRTSRSDADKQIKQILGNESGEKFMGLARRYWSGDSAELGAKPNSVPTDTRVVINAPGYRMDLFKDGQLVKSYKIGIGYPEFPLPVGVRTAKSIIFNPTWTPPDEPWVKGEFQPGKTVEAGSKKNPLGVLKIPIGLPSLIHGGKDQARLGTFASHGCVGLTNQLVQDFAAQLASLSGTQLSPQQVKEYEKQRSETKEVNLGQTVPVELRYETIVVEDGKLRIFRDVYEHGTNTEENVNRVLEIYGVTMASFTPEEQNQIREALKKMALDPQGKPVEEDTDKDKKPSTSSKVTRNIKGAKEVVIEIAALRGKGYPAPVNINA